MNSKTRLRVGLTGGIASGKSFVLSEFAKLGAKTIDTDVIAHKIIRKGTVAYKRIVAEFGPAVLTPNKEINRKKLGALVFINNKKRKLLENITHKYIIAEMKSQISVSKSGVFVVDAPLLFEAGLDCYFDKIVCVWAPKSVQVKRLAERNNLSAAEALLRIKSQMPLARKKKLSDFVIDNSVSFEKTRRQVRQLWEVLVA